MSGERGPRFERSPEWEPRAGGHREGNRTEIATPAIEYLGRMVGKLRALATPGRYSGVDERNAVKAEVQGDRKSVV